MKILPFRPVLTDLAANFWQLRAFFLLLFAIFLADGVLLYVAEELVGNAGARGLWFWLGVALDDIFPPRLIDCPAQTALGTILRKFNGFLGYVLLGLIFHAIRESFSGHNLRTSRWLFLATNQEARR